MHVLPGTLTGLQTASKFPGEGHSDTGLGIVLRATFYLYHSGCSKVNPASGWSRGELRSRKVERVR